MKLLLFIILSFTYTCYSMNPRLWTRIPQYFVRERVIYFLDNNKISNCFEFQETPSNLLLKCWRDNKLVDVNIDIQESYKKQNLYATTISI